jgi:TolB-like protein/Tfp pilus assembly protein PilF
MHEEHIGSGVGITPPELLLSGLPDSWLGKALSLFEELKRRNVFRVGVAYLVASWVLMQILDVITPILELPESAPRLVLVILAIGLIPVLVFAWAFELTPEGLKKEADVDRSSSIVNETARKLNYVITGFLVVAVVLLLVERQLRPVVEVEPESVAATEEAQAPATEKSIAVLPFVNMSSDEEQDYFSDGITEEILNSLAGVKELKVAGRTSSFAFKGQNDDLRRIGDSLGVEHILEGSVRKAGAKVRITAQLIQVEDGFHLWSETYDRELTDVFAIQDEIANEILKQLKAELLDTSASVAIASRTTPEVYELYLEAKQRIYTREREEIRAAADELDSAIQLDPNYAPVLAQRAIATMLLSDQQYGEIPHDETRRRAKRYIDEALRLDPNHAEGWAALGLYHDQESEPAIDALVKALEINPNLIDASNWLQIALRQSGQMRSALDILLQIAERDPLYRPAFSNAMQLFNAFGRTEEAEALVNRIAAFDSTNPDLHLARATNLMYSGRVGEGLLEIEKRVELGPMSGVGEMFLSIGLLRSGQAERALTEGSSYWRPSALYDLGRIDEAIELAYEHARSGSPYSLIYMLPRQGRSQELIDFLEERWPTLRAFASEFPGGDGGYDLMMDIALAYRNTGNEIRQQQALELVRERLDLLESEGVDFVGFDFNSAIYFAATGEIDRSIDYLKNAVDRGAIANSDPIVNAPELAVLEDDPRYPLIRAGMLANFNANREVLGLPPYDENFQVMADPN